jgi:hypothetical protein
MAYNMATALTSMPMEPSMSENTRMMLNGMASITTPMELSEGHIPTVNGFANDQQTSMQKGFQF